jgi:hypothetical protein
MSSFYRPIPREVFQDTTKFTCWAAALESWISVTPDSPASWYISSQEDAIRECADLSDSKKGLSVKDILGFQWLAAACGMRFDVFKPAKKLMGGFLYSKLKSRSHLYIFFAGGDTNLGNGLAHASVIYGVDKPWGNDCTLGVMDSLAEGNCADAAFENLSTRRRDSGGLVGVW